MRDPKTIGMDSMSNLNDHHRHNRDLDSTLSEYQIRSLTQSVLASQLPKSRYEEQEDCVELKSECSILTNHNHGLMNRNKSNQDARQINCWDDIWHISLLFRYTSWTTNVTSLGESQFKRHSINACSFITGVVVVVIIIVSSRSFFIFFPTSTFTYVMRISLFYFFPRDETSTCLWQIDTQRHASQFHWNRMFFLYCFCSLLYSWAMRYRLRSVCVLWWGKKRKRKKKRDQTAQWHLLILCPFVILNSLKKNFTMRSSYSQ